MELVAAAALAFGFGWLISSMGGSSLDRAVDALAAVVGGWRPDGWPRGVQEEDRDRPWGRSPTAKPIEPMSLTPPLTKVRPTTVFR